MIKVLIVDDHDILRAGLKYILQDTGDIEVGGEATDGHGALARIRAEGWDVVVLDLSMPGKSGVELIRQIKSEYPRLPVLVLSMHKENIYAIRTLRAGASGYLCKDHAETQLPQAIRKVAAGGLFINAAVAEKLAAEMLNKNPQGLPHHRLSNREYEVFDCIVRGQGVTEIAHRLNLSIKTVSTHKARILEKMALGNTAELVRYAVRHRLLDESDGLNE